MSKPYIGGQAVLEGVMMRSPQSFVVAVRKPDGTIAVREQPWTTFFAGVRFLRWPFVRGAVVLLESLHNGFSALKFSTEHALPEESVKQSAAGAGRKLDLSSSAMLIIATLLMLGLFIAAPHLLTYRLSRLVGPALDSSGVLFHLVDGVLRLAILLGYLLLISKTRDAARLFQYHGAEHKAIWTYESGLPLTVENARPFTTFHPRCGTSFLFVVVCVAVLLHVALLPFIPTLSPNRLVHQLLLVLIKVPIAFPIAGIAYELQRLSARERCPSIIRALTRPGIWLQRITTREPADGQLEIALLALERALAREEGRSQAADGVAIYRDFGMGMAA
ncbi:MAG TPA: DUF1385 domain-containing protein [Myxococcaceae bacterium]|nr:DUF1385 domain-containing protein [Myxococcaceae bacterium]